VKAFDLTKRHSCSSKYFLLLRLHFNNYNKLSFGSNDISYYYFKDTAATAILISLAFLCVRLITSTNPEKIFSRKHKTNVTKNRTNMKRNISQCGIKTMVT